MTRTFLWPRCGFLVGCCDCSGRLVSGDGQKATRPMFVGREWRSPKDGVVGELAETLADAGRLAQVLLQQVGEDLQHYLVRKLLLQVLFRRGGWGSTGTVGTVSRPLVTSHPSCPTNRPLPHAFPQHWQPRTKATHYIACHLADAFIQSDLQLIRLSRRHTPWSDVGLRASLKGPTAVQILSWPHQGSNHRPWGVK